MKFVECSARENINVESLFLDAGELLLFPFNLFRI